MTVKAFLERVSLAGLGLLAVAPAAAQQIGRCFDTGSYVSGDRVAEQEFRLGLRYFEQRQYVAAFPHLSLAAQRGHARAQELTGQMYMFGFGVDPDAKMGFQNLNAAAAQGHRGAISDMGFYYSLVDVDLPRANRYFLAAAQCGMFVAMVELGFNYEFARGVPWNRREAIYWLSKAAPNWGQAAFVAEWLQRPGTPHFANADQLGQYIGRMINQRVLISGPSTGIPKPGTPSCYQSISVYCGSDPTSLFYQRTHGR